MPYYINYYKKRFNILSLNIPIAGFLCLSTLLSLNTFGQQADCNCTEYLYVNNDRGGEVHKYIIDANGSLNEIGTPWYPGSGVSELPRPHGLGVDLNGNIYVSETPDRPIRKLNCAGDIVPAAQFSVLGSTGRGAWNISSIGNTLYANTNWLSTNPIETFDLCTGQLTGSVCLEGVPTNFAVGQWGLWIDPDTKTIYATDYLGQVYVFDESAVNGACVPVLVNLTTLPTPSSLSNIRGITNDDNGNIYIIAQGFNDPSIVIKIDANGNYITSSAPDGTEGDGGWARATGIVYSETSGLLYVSSESAIEDCVTSFNTDLNVTNAVVGPSNGEGNSKGININRECCPAQSIQEFDIVQCVPSFPADFFLQELIDCGGPICEGTDFVASPLNTNTTLTSCNNSITTTSVGCSTFIKGSNGLGDNNQCGTFNITVNICFEASAVAPVISITDNTCRPNVDGSINIDTPCTNGNTLEWSIDAGATWSASQPAYVDTPITVRARCSNDCSSAESTDISSAPQDCCLPENCISQFGEFIIIKN